MDDNKARLQGAPPRMRFAVHTAPWRQLYVLACAKGMGALETMGIRRGSLKVEIGPPETEIFWLGEGGGRPRVVGTWTPQGGWSMKAGLLETLILGVEMGTLLQRMSVRPS